VLARVIAAEEEQGRSFAMAIHDQPIQVLAAACMQLSMLRRAFDAEPAASGRLDELERTMAIAIAQLRHIVIELMPPGLADESLARALDLYVDELDRESATRYRFHDRSVSQPDATSKVVLYRIAQHVLGNVRKHARATGVDVTLADRDDGHHVLVLDDGIGFAADGDPAESRAGSGLVTMRARTEEAGGRLVVASEPGRGTSVDCWLPALAERFPVCVPILGSAS
jgi:signal transduction histidine kinase